MEMNILLDTLGRIAEAAVIGLIVWNYKQGTKLAVLEALFKEKKDAVATALSVSADHHTRIALLEQAVTEFRELAKDLKPLPALLSALQALLASSNARLDKVERAQE